MGNWKSDRTKYANLRIQLKRLSVDVKNEGLIMPLDETEQNELLEAISKITELCDATIEMFDDTGCAVNAIDCNEQEQK
jgi:hypothetical protein